MRAFKPGVFPQQRTDGGQHMQAAEHHRAVTTRWLPRHRPSAHLNLFRFAQLRQYPPRTAQKRHPSSVGDSARQSDETGNAQSAAQDVTARVMAGREVERAGGSRKANAADATANKGAQVSKRSIILKLK